MIIPHVMHAREKSGTQVWERTVFFDLWVVGRCMERKWKRDTPEQAGEMNESLPETAHQEELLVTDISDF
jgi:hypothetical protein